MPVPIPCNGDLDTTSDAIDDGQLHFQFLTPATDSSSSRRLFTVNRLKGSLWNDDSEFDATKYKSQFRQYDDACDGVKDFYREQHGSSIFSPLFCLATNVSLLNRQKNKQ
jgi:inositol oxygenase